MVTTLFAYDGNGNLLGQYDSSGNTEQEFIRLGRLPIAVVQNGQVYDIYTDQRGAPRAIADSSGTVIWRWSPTPFGNTAANDDPDGNGVAFVFNLRFPGQYYDAETGRNYNDFRYYDPSTGRYITSDPIGLNGGLNTYGYVYDNPINYIDPLGLDVTIFITRLHTTSQYISGTITAISSNSDGTVSGNTLEHTNHHVKAGTYSAAIQIKSYTTGKVYEIPRIRLLKDSNQKDPNIPGGQIHNGSTLDDSTGCSLAGYNNHYNVNNGSDWINGSKPFMRDLNKLIQKDGGKITVIYADTSGGLP